VPDCTPDVPLVIPGAEILSILPKTISAPHLLLVDDDLFLRELVAESLRDAGYEVHEADDGRDALAATCARVHWCSSPTATCPT
jgi:response regulator RpfG family c-di-GMP phosphodiesterase